jgi:Pyruvate/2-oxoacid:ferredoxin oxidoreductase delta subunit
MCSTPTIKNAHLPSCKNCIHFAPDKYYHEYATTMSKCNKFGDKDIVTDKITYRYADACRVDEKLCGKEGKYFEEDPHIQWKVLGHRALHILPYVMIYGILLLSICAKVFVK